MDGSEKMVWSVFGRRQKRFLISLGGGEFLAYISRMSAFGKLSERAREVNLIHSTSSLLQWDQEIMLSPLGAEYRAEQLAYLSGHSHRLWTSDEVGEWIEQAADEVEEGSADAVDVERWKQDFERSRKLPVELVERSARIESEGHESWKDARAQSDFKRFLPKLEELIEVSVQKAECWGYANEAYDALLESYEPGLTAEQLRELFGPLAPKLAEIAAQAGRLAVPESLPGGEYPLEKQQAFNRKVIKEMGFNLDRGRIDASVHPFSSSMGPNDNRITTRYDLSDFTSSFFGLLHEAGHGLYEQGLPVERFGRPSGSSVSLGIHESQSRFWENQVGRSLAFWNYWFPAACDTFPQLREWSVEEIVAYVNSAKPSFIRVDAAEIGYDLHVILRFEVEESLFSGKLQAADIPDFWNDRFKEIIGLDVPDDTRGCLQDIHWSMGGFGYFPTYTLGSINAAQMAKAVEKETGGMAALLESGNTAPILKFLREKIHKQGRRFQPDELMKHATGEPMQYQYLIDYFEKKVQAGPVQF